MPSQFAKRRKKSQLTELEKNISEVVEEAVKEVIKEATAPEPVAKPKVPSNLHNISYDITKTEAGYQLVIIHYNLESGESAIVGTKPVGRQIGLKFDNNKKAMKTLLKIRE